MKLLLVLAVSLLSFSANACPIEGCPGTATCYKAIVVSGSSNTGCKVGYHVTSCSNGYWDGSGPYCPMDPAPQTLPSVPTVNGTNTDSTFYGYLNGVNKSPSGGRLVGAIAVLDTCWNNGYSTTNNLYNRSSCYSACDNGTTNYACSGLTGANTCYTRCEGAFAN